MSISIDDARRLKEAGFSDWEIQELANAKDPEGKDQPPIDLNKAVWLAVLKSREEWVKDKKDRGWSEKEIEDEVTNYYLRDTRRTPFDFLKAEYRPRKRVDYWTAVRESKQMGIEVAIEDYYEPGETVRRQENQRRSTEELGRRLYEGWKEGEE